MSASMEKAPATYYGQLTSEAISRLRQRVGLQFKYPRTPHNFEVSWDGSRHFAYGYGDDNPLWSDPEYGRTTRWGGLITPPAFLYTMGEAEAPPVTPGQRALLKGDPMAGLGSYQAVMEFEWWRPLHIGDRLKLRTALLGVEVNEQSSFSGRTVSEIQGFLYRNQRDELHAIRRGTWVRAERQASAEKKKAYELPVPYTPAQLAEIDAAYDRETIRGSSPLYFEDVQTGDELPTMVRGPLRTSDLILWHLGWGMQLTPPGSFGLSYKVRKKAPGMFTPNALNIPDTVQRLHWEKEWSSQLGIPAPYDYGGLREAFLTNIITNWMGDHGWLWKMSCQHRKFVYTGDTYWMTGKVASKDEVEGRKAVRLELAIANQWGTVVTPGEATVLLPSRHNPVELPHPVEEDVDRMIDQQVASYTTG